MSFQLPFIRALRNMTRPKGIAMRPRPASGIAHMGRPRSPIRLAEGGSTSTPIAVNDGTISGGLPSIYSGIYGGQDGANLPNASEWGLAQNYLPGIAAGALGGLTSGAANIYGNQGRPSPIGSRATNNPFAIPSISRSTDPVTQAISQHVNGYQAWPGSNAPTSGNTGMFGGYAPGTNGSATPQRVAFSNGPSVTAGGPVQAAPTVAANGGIRRAAGGSIPSAAMMPGGTPEEGKNKQSFMGAIMALKGQSPDPQAALRAFVQHWGPQALQDLQQQLGAMQQPQRPGGGGGGTGQPNAPGQAVPQQMLMHPGAANGMNPPQQQIPQGPAKGMVSGPGDGMSDNVVAQHSTNGGKILLSDGEYVIGSSDVSALGNGSTKAGAKKLDLGIAKLRAKKTGRVSQPKALAANENPIFNH